MIVICFFDPFFFLNKEKYTQWAAIDVALSALAYLVEKVEPGDPEGVEAAEGTEEQQPDAAAALASEQAVTEQAAAQSPEQGATETAEQTAAQAPEEIAAEASAGAESAGTAPEAEAEVDAAQYFPCGEKGDSAEIEFIVEEAIPVACIGRLFWRMTGVIMRSDDAKEMRIHVYASEQVLKGYIPQPGDDVMAIAWIQGRLLGVTPFVRET